MKLVLLRTLPAIAAAMAISGCGGGDNAQTTELSGTAAVGASVRGGAVGVTCGTATASSVTGDDGTWSASVSDAAFPCVIKVSGGSLAAGVELYGYATSATNVNVTPLTTLIGAYATAAANGDTPTQAQLEAATTKVMTMLTDAGFTNLPDNPLTATFKPAAGDAHDDLIEALMLTLSQQGKTLAEVAADIAADGDIDTAAIVTPSVVAFSSIADPLPPNMPSYGPEAYALSSLGDRVALAADTPRNLRGVTVAMSSWACESGSWNLATCVSAAGATFTHPITLRVYNTSGTLLAERTQTFTMPYRPSTDTAKCTGGRWQAADGTCYNGFAFKIDFDFTSSKVTLPDEVVYKVSYSTRTHGPAPLGVTGPYDSLNIGTYSTTVSPRIGTDPDAGHLIWNDAPRDTSADLVGGLTAQFLVGK